MLGLVGLALEFYPGQTAALSSCQSGRRAMEVAPVSAQTRLYGASNVRESSCNHIQQWRSAPLCF